ncbi:MAG: glycoside hydrolase family 16 protein [Bacteroidia bacterium]
MKIRTLLTLLPLIFPLKQVSGQILIEFSEGRSLLYTIHGGDEFTETVIDREKWLTSYPWARHLYCSMDVNVYSDGEDLIQNNGMLKITARKSAVTTRAIPYEKDDYPLTCDYKPTVKNLMNFEYQSGLIYSKQQFTYGYYEIRFRADAGDGLWPAFWLFGKDNKEIDVFEIGGFKTKAYHVDIHCKNGCDNYKRFLGIFKSNWGGYIETNSDWSASFHTMGVNWTSEGITWILDGTPIAWWKGSFNDPMSVIANLAVTNKEGSFGGKVNDKTPFPATMEVDYIRVWQPDEHAVLRPATSEKRENSTTSHVTGCELKKKIRPGYKKKVLASTPDRIQLEWNNIRDLEVSLYSTQATRYNYSIQSENGKIWLSGSLQSGVQSIHLPQLLPGKYALVLKNERTSCKVSLELPG